MSDEPRPVRVFVFSHVADVDDIHVGFRYYGVLGSKAQVLVVAMKREVALTHYPMGRAFRLMPEEGD